MIILLTAVIVAHTIIVMLFIAGLAAAAKRPIPPIDNIVQLPANAAADDSSARKVA